MKRDAQDNNAALAAARRWCEVTGINYVPALLEEGRARATGARLAISFREALLIAITARCRLSGRGPWSSSAG